MKDTRSNTSIDLKSREFATNTNTMTRLHKGNAMVKKSNSFPC